MPKENKKNKTSVVLSKQVKSILKPRNVTSNNNDALVPKLQKKIKAIKSSNEMPSTSPQHAKNEIDTNEEEFDEQQQQPQFNEEREMECEQLYGSNFDENMIDIGNGIFCRENIHDMALGTSHKSTHVARKLLEGIFKKEFLLRSTLTGLPPRAQGKKRQSEPVIQLNLKAVVEFSIQAAIVRCWTKQTASEIERSMSQRIGEIKRNHRKQKDEFDSEDDEDEEENPLAVLRAGGVKRIKRT